MGVYVYRVTAQLVTLTDGRKVHVCRYAFKPYSDWSSGSVNRRAYVRTGCLASERLKLKSDLLVVLDTHGHVGNVYQNKQGLRVFYDDTTFGTENMPRIGTVERAGLFGDKYTYKPREFV